jgi:hypothetical protein
MMATRCSKFAMTIGHVGSNPTIHNEISSTAQSNTISDIIYYVLVTSHGVLIANWIYWMLTARNYK